MVSCIEITDLLGGLPEFVPPAKKKLTIAAAPS